MAITRKSTEMEKAAKDFAEYWKGKGYEKGESQRYWLGLLGQVFGVEDPSRFVVFEEQVKLDHTSFIDVMIPSTHVMIEQKSIDKDLLKPIKQSDGSQLNPFQQAKRYSSELPYSQRPRWIVTCNFKEFLVYDMENPNGEPERILLEDLPKEYHRLGFLVDTGDENIKREEEISIKAGEVVGKLYNALLKQYVDPENTESLKSLNVLCVRLVFCFYAEDAGVFGKHLMFHDYLKGFDARHFRSALIELFKVLNTKEIDRDTYLDDELKAFPYVNGGLFADGNIEIPQFTDEIRTLILQKASADLDWSEISPTIFGAVFESTLNPETRRSGGMHYTSVENIHKVIDPLFLDDLKAEFEEIREIKTVKTRNDRLTQFCEKLASLKFLDPACGSGNFLTETYLSLRKMENEAISLIHQDQIVMGEWGDPIKVGIDQFYGIEINDFAVTVAKTALWIAESQMMKKTEEIVSQNIEFLPLTTNACIVEGNALRMDWNDVVPASELNYIMGNPPFVGYAYQSNEQKEELSQAVNGIAQNIDYVSGWYYKASEMIQDTIISVAFVSTNSITQGEQVAAVWKPLYKKYGITINFAYTTFRWDSEAYSKAHVHCVIIGFSTKDNKEKHLYSGDRLIIADNINPYLLNADNVFIERRSKPLCDVPEMVRGSQPTDDGNFILTEAEKDELLRNEPQAGKFIRPFMMGKDFIQRKPRYCIWLVAAQPSEIRTCRRIMDRVENVRQFRLASKKKATRDKADTPTLFDEIRDAKSDYVAVPKVSSENRRYIPIDYLTVDTIAGDKLFMMTNSTLFHFGVLTSNVHMAWMRAVAGRLKSDYSYSNTIVYNNFPWPTPPQTSTRKG